ncbi:hypothetical protein D3C81_1170790 [compost metagenome]
MARTGQIDLLLPLTGAGAGLLAQAVPAVRTADARHVVLVLAIRHRHRVAAGMTLVVVTLTEIVAHGDPVVEHEAVAAPQALLRRHLLEVLEDAALEVEHLGEALAEHVAGGLLATDATGAEHRHLLVLRRVEVLLHVLGELAERLGLRVDGACEGADGHLVVVARVDQQHLRVGDQRIPVLRLDIGADRLARVDAGHAQGDDLLLELDLGAVERLLAAIRFLVVDVDQPRIGVQPGQQRVDGGAAAGHGAVDAFRRQQQGALDAVFQHRRQQRLAQGDVILEGDELVQRRHHDVLTHDALQWSPAQGADRILKGSRNDNAGGSRRGADSSKGAGRRGTPAAQWE